MSSDVVEKPSSNDAPAERAKQSPVDAIHLQSRRSIDAMARHKPIDTSPRFLAVDFSRQLIPGTIEHALHHPLDHEIDLSAVDQRFKNNRVGASAKAKDTPASFSDRMKREIDSPEGREKYGRRFATVELVFGNLRVNQGLDRFTLRGRKKVDAQWKLFCLVHNIEKLAHNGYAQ